MSDKRTPQPKNPHKGPQNRPSASKYRTPTNLNVTSLERREPSSKRYSSRPTSASKPLQPHSSLEMPGVGNLSLAGPTMKPRALLNSGAARDYDLECDLLYSDYLQAVVKKQILKKTFKTHKQDLKNQLAIQKDNLFQSKLKLKNVQQELAQVDKVAQLHELVDILNENCDEVIQLCEKFDLNNTLDKLVAIFESICSKASVKNVSTLQTTEDYHQLKLAMKRCVVQCQLLQVSETDKEVVTRLADSIHQFQELSAKVAEEQKSLSQLQKDVTFHLFKSISDFYAEKRKNSEK